MINKALVTEGDRTQARIYKHGVGRRAISHAPVSTNISLFAEAELTHSPRLQPWAS